MIELTRPTYDGIVSHAYDGGEEEVCGVLAGPQGAGADPSRVTRRYEATNVADAPRTRYLIDPEEQLELMERAEDDDLDVVGFYHSHPTGPTRPSETDAVRATWLDRSYVICALDGHPFVGSWRWRGDAAGFEQETVALRSER